MHFFMQLVNKFCSFLVSVAFQVSVVYCPNLGHDTVVWTYKADRFKELKVVSCQFSGNLNVEKSLHCLQVILHYSARRFAMYTFTSLHHNTLRQARSAA